MTGSEIQALVSRQREYYKSGATLDTGFRISKLKKLYEAVKRHEKDIARALKEDLGKSGYESYMCETGMVLSEISISARTSGWYSSTTWV